jgi:hypothetical protein
MTFHGVSTGALMSTPPSANQDAPGTALCPPYIKADPRLDAGTMNVSTLPAYAISQNPICSMSGDQHRSALLSGSIATFEPLRRLLEALISEDTIRSVADEANKKRKLFVGVTNPTTAMDMRLI